MLYCCTCTAFVVNKLSSYFFTLYCTPRILARLHHLVAHLYFFHATDYRKRDVTLQCIFSYRHLSNNAASVILLKHNNKTGEFNGKLVKECLCWHTHVHLHMHSWTHMNRQKDRPKHNATVAHPTGCQRQKSTKYTNKLIHKRFSNLLLSTSYI